MEAMEADSNKSNSRQENRAKVPEDFDWLARWDAIGEAVNPLSSFPVVPTSVQAKEDPTKEAIAALSPFSIVQPPVAVLLWIRKLGCAESYSLFLRLPYHHSHPHPLAAEQATYRGSFCGFESWDVQEAISLAKNVLSPLPAVVTCNLPCVEPARNRRRAAGKMSESRDVQEAIAAAAKPTLSPVPSVVTYNLDEPCIESTRKQRRIADKHGSVDQIRGREDIKGCNIRI